MSSAIVAGVVGFGAGGAAAVLLARNGILQRLGVGPRSTESEVDHDTIRQRLRMAGHDLRSCLGPVVGYADLIKMSKDISQAQLHADKINQAANKIESIANELTETVLGPNE